jgi:hypothetical protein
MGSGAAFSGLLAAGLLVRYLGKKKRSKRTGPGFVVGAVEGVE